MILLEYACKTEYQMITRQIEREHGEKLAQLETKYKSEFEKLEKSEARSKAEARELRQLCDELTRAKREEEKRKDQIMQEHQKNLVKHEEEVQLRLFFEQKLNSLHHVNREITSKYKNMKAMHAEQKLKATELTEKLDKVTQELNILKDQHQL